MGWKLRNKETGFEIPLTDEPTVNQACLAYEAWLPFDQAHHHFFMSDYDLEENFEFPTKMFAVILGQRVQASLESRPDGLFTLNGRGMWKTPGGAIFATDYLRDNFRNFKVLFEGVDE